MTILDQRRVQSAWALLTACLSQVTARQTSEQVRFALLSEATDAAETIEALADPSRDVFAPTSFPPKAAPDMRPDRLLLAQSLLLGHARSRHLKVAA
ncbi:hypothetical protein EAH89_28525 [Roseomonas nepalensis]|uniref:Uncharacterized protein n=1 Tax=Muricoccus nepalensis TaxID=1854500 RepID=A0A502EXN1_9PROT|nr:hypothetical protein [Roseomonas nepalensis]TPG41872.1 hypothetical protein EAH89_28525 [Roseomonas nepalensis]